MYLTNLSNNLQFDKNGICRDFSFYMLSIFEMLGFGIDKITLVLAPGHVFVRYINNNLDINFETMDFLKTHFPEKNIYMVFFNIHMYSISEKVFLSNLNDNRIKSFFYENYAILLNVNFINYYYFKGLKFKRFESSKRKIIFECVRLYSEFLKLCPAHKHLERGKYATKFIEIYSK